MRMWGAGWLFDVWCIYFNIVTASRPCFLFTVSRVTVVEATSSHEISPSRGIVVVHFFVVASR